MTKFARCKSQLLGDFLRLPQPVATPHVTPLQTRVLHATPPPR